ncbi:MAG: ROK family protein [Angustibacter sp.]
MVAQLLAGVDVGGTKVLAVVTDEHLTVRGRARLTTRRGERGVLDTVARAVTEAARRAGVSPAVLDVVGVGVPGLVDVASGQVAHAVNLGLDDEPTDLAAGLRDLLGVPVVLENDVNAAALGAQALRRGGSDLALLSIGTGLAAGLVLGGRLHRGARGAAGEIGHVPVDPAGAPCSCGQRGCLETVASGAALAAAWPAGPGRGGSPWEAAAAGDDRARAAVERFSAGVAAAVRLLVLTWDVETVVLTGGVTEVGRPLLEAVRHALRAQGAGSPLIAALGLPERVVLLDRSVPVAALGAALAACGRLVDVLPPAQEVS